MTRDRPDRETEAPSRPLEGFGRLLRFMIRRDRVRASVWVASIVGLMATSTVSIVGLYDTPEKLQEYARLVGSDVAFKAIAGPGHGLDHPTTGAVLMNEILIYSFILVALMSIFMTVRHTRAEEDDGRAELVRATPIGHLAIPVAACTWVAAINVAVALGLAGLLLAFGLPAAGTVAFVAATCGVGLVFTAVAVLTAQVASGGRTARAAAGAALGASFLLRAVGDLGTDWVVWLSPLGWAQSVRAFGGEQWWVLVPLAVATTVLAGAATWFAARRDLGAGLFDQRPGPAHAGPRLASPVALAARLTRNSLISWTVGLVIIGYFFGLVAEMADELLKDQAVADFFEGAGTGTPTELFMSTMVLMIALLGSGFAVSVVLRLRTEEREGRAAPVLAAPVDRRRWMLGYLIVSLAGTLIVLTASGLSLGAGHATRSGDLELFLPVLGASLAMVPAIAVLAGGAFALVGFRPAWAPLAWAGVAVSAVVGLLAETLNLPQWMRNISPFEHVPALPAAPFDAAPLAALAGVAAAAFLAGLALLRRRDIV